LSPTASCDNCDLIFEPFHLVLLFLYTFFAMTFLETSVANLK